MPQGVSTPMLIVGQDLAAIRGYMHSACCAAPDGYTAYLAFYDLLSSAHGFGGLGLDSHGAPIDLEYSWGAGPVNAYKTATEFGGGHLAIGLSIAENEHPGGLDALLEGAFDANIDQLAQLFRHVEGAVFLRIGYEFDGAWNHGYGNAARFVRAWRRIVDRLRLGDAGNVRFLWQASASPIDDVLDGSPEDIVHWYPGDDYVDWLGFSWFLHPTATPMVAGAKPPKTQRQLADQVLALARAAGKPVMVAEAAPQGFHLGKLTRANISPLWDGPAGESVRPVTEDEIWRAWYGPLFDYLNANSDVVRGLAYVNCPWDQQPRWGPPYDEGYWGDSRLQLRPRLARRFSEAVAAWRD